MTDIPRGDILNNSNNIRFRKQLFNLPSTQIVSILCRYTLHKIKHKINSLQARLQLSLWGGNIGENLFVAGNIRCNNYGKLTIGNMISINSGADRNFVGGDHKTSFWIGKGASLTIGNNVKISGTTIVSFSSITIADDTIIGGGCSIYDTDFHPVNSLDRLEHKNCIVSKPVIIGPRCFIGAHSIILKGVHIGEGSVVGSGSVVTKNIPPNEIWAGNPARFIKTINQNENQ